MPLSDEQRKRLAAQRDKKPSRPRPLFIQRRENKAKLRDRVTNENADLLLLIEQVLVDLDAELDLTDAECHEILTALIHDRIPETYELELAVIALKLARKNCGATDKEFQDACHVLCDSIERVSNRLPRERSYLDHVQAFLRLNGLG